MASDVVLESIGMGLDHEDRGPLLQCFKLHSSHASCIQSDCENRNHSFMHILMQESRGDDKKILKASMRCVGISDHYALIDGVKKRCTVAATTPLSYR
jgi:hypothetical protein